MKEVVKEAYRQRNGEEAGRSGLKSKQRNSVTTEAVEEFMDSYREANGY